MRLKHCDCCQVNASETTLAMYKNQSNDSCRLGGYPETASGWSLFRVEYCEPYEGAI